MKYLVRFCSIFPTERAVPPYAYQRETATGDPRGFLHLFVDGTAHLVQGRLIHCVVQLEILGQVHTADGQADAVHQFPVFPQDHSSGSPP